MPVDLVLAHGSQHLAEKPLGGLLPARLLRRSDFLRVQAGNRRFRSANMTLLVALQPPADPALAAHGAQPDARLGYTVSRKVGNAVVRNRVKRRLREAVRLDEKGLLKAYDHVLIAHPLAASKAFVELAREVTWLLAKAHAACSSAQPPSRSFGRTV